MDGIAEMWQTAQTIDEIWGRLWWLNFNLVTANALLAVLIITIRRKGDK